METNSDRSSTSCVLSASMSTLHNPSPPESLYLTPPSTSRKRTIVRNDGELPTPKRRKPTGRPKNGWTPSRRRKLVRLYLMTELNVDELAATLRTDRFKPWCVGLLELTSPSH